LFSPSGSRPSALRLTGTAARSSLLSVFREELSAPPAALGWNVSDPLGPRCASAPPVLTPRRAGRTRSRPASGPGPWGSHAPLGAPALNTAAVRAGRDVLAEHFKPHWFWDGQAMVVSRGAIEAINGFDEVLDIGNGCSRSHSLDPLPLYVLFYPPSRAPLSPCVSCTDCHVNRCACLSSQTATCRTSATASPFSADRHPPLRISLPPRPRDRPPVYPPARQNSQSTTSVLANIHRFLRTFNYPGSMYCPRAQPQRAGALGRSGSPPRR